MTHRQSPDPGPRTGPGLGLAAAAFVALGLPDGAIGTTWPALADDLGTPVERLGVALAVLTAAYLITAALHGPIVARLGLGPSLRIASGATVVGALVVAAAPAVVVVGAGLALIGAGGSIIDAGFNTVVARTGDLRAMHRVHTAFGLGATVAPLVVAALLGLGLSWRVAFVLIAVAQGPLWLRYGRLPKRHAHGGGDDERPDHGPVRSRSLVVRSLVGFALVVGLEVTALQFSPSLLVERGWSPSAAGLWAASAWGAFTLVRLAGSAVGHRVRPARTLLAGTAVVLAGALVLWSDPAGLGAPALPFVGAGLAPLFPALASLTPERAGPDRTSTVMGWQLAASSVGMAGLPLLVAALAGAHGLGVLGLVAAGGAALLLILEAGLPALRAHRVEAPA